LYPGNEIGLTADAAEWDQVATLEPGNHHITLQVYCFHFRQCGFFIFAAIVFIAYNDGMHFKHVFCFGLFVISCIK